MLGQRRSGASPKAFWRPREMSYQAIETKFFGPTNHRGARIRVRCQARTMFVAWDYSLGIDHNHDAAARALAEKLAWRGSWFAGCNVAGSGNVYVNANDPC